VVGESVCVFTGTDGNRMCPIMGWHHGKFNIVYDSDLGTDVVADSRGRPIEDIRDGKVIRARKAEGRKGGFKSAGRGHKRRLTVTDFKDKIRKHMK